jgi:hypothetical protein
MDLLEQPDRARRLAAAARETCARYAWPVARQGWLAAYHAALDRHAVPVPRAESI